MDKDIKTPEVEPKPKKKKAETPPPVEKGKPETRRGAVRVDH